jgi:hypothetical protein
MKKNSIIIVLLSFILFTACEKEDFNGMSDLRPAVPVTVSNAIDFRPEPTVLTSISGGGSIKIDLEIPASTGRTIKEVTRIAVSTTYSKIQGTTGLYNAAPIAVNSTKYSFATSLAEYVIKGPGTIPPVSTTVGTELANRFYFLITLDDGSVIIPESVRVLVTN